MADDLNTTERVLTVGTQVPLVGVYSSPEQVRARSTGLIILNSGLMHHVGTCNLSVRYARAAGSAGIPSFRFDLSGIGDSRARVADETRQEREISEVREVMDCLSREFGLNRFILCGLCSGADLGLVTAARDERVAGIIQMDPVCFRTHGWYLYHLAPRILSLNFWKRRWQRLFNKIPDFESLPEEYLPREYLDEYNELFGQGVDRAVVTANYEKLVTRGTRILVLMTGGQESCYNALGQFRKAFAEIDFANLLDEHFLPSTEHIITEPDDQEYVVNLVKNWSLTVESA